MTKFMLVGLCLSLVVVALIGADVRDSLTGPRVSVDGYSLLDGQGQRHALSDVNSRLVVLAFLGTECPLARLYAQRLEEISEKYAPEEVTVLGIDSNRQDTLAEIQEFTQRQELSFPVLKDVEHRLADAVGAERTPQVVVLDEERRIRYRGRIDDQYLIGIIRSHPQREELKQSLEELLHGWWVSTPRTEALGCLIGRDREADESSPVTYSNQISRLFQKRCTSCHRSGEIAPFSLTSYEEVLGWGPTIAEVVRENRMPPWHADPAHGRFANDCRLSAEEKDLVATWVEHGCPQGDPSQQPPPQKFTDGWQLPRPPDLVLPIAEQPFVVPATVGPQGLPYQDFWVPTGFTEDRWITETEVRPGNKSVVHHVIVYLAPGGRDQSLHETQLIGAYIPGLRLGELYPVGAARRIPAGSWLLFRMHYTPTGVPQEDLTSFGMTFIDPALVRRELFTPSVSDQRLLLKPYQANQKLVAETEIYVHDAELLSITPHMHLRGKSFKLEALYPDGTKEVLLKVPQYDFNWQRRYLLDTPKPLPMGTRLRCTAVFDNSAKNLANPDPSATVTWGEQTWDEMMIGYMEVTVPVETTVEEVLGSEVQFDTPPEPVP